MFEKPFVNPEHDTSTSLKVEIVETGDVENGGIGFVLEVPDVGGAEVVLDPDGTYFIEWVSVEPEQQGKGVATALFSRAKEHAVELHARVVESYLTTPGSVRAASRAFGEQYIIKELRDELRRLPDDEDYNGGELYPTYTLSYPINPALE